MPQLWVLVYLDTDTTGDDLLDNAGNPITAGWYRYKWPFTDEPVLGPYETVQEANADWLNNG